MSGFNTITVQDHQRDGCPYEVDSQREEGLCFEIGFQSPGEKGMEFSRRGKSVKVFRKESGTIGMFGLPDAIDEWQVVAEDYDKTFDSVDAVNRIVKWLLIR